MVKISNRLMTAAALVTQGYTLADVGTDHGYIPIYLLQQKKIPAAIAMDINEGPLERAKKHIALYGLQAYIQTRLSDGVAALKPGEVEAVLIAGMGGETIIAILSAAPWTRNGHMLLLQPMTKAADLRHWLAGNGYTFTAECLVEDKGRVYPILTVTGGAHRSLTEAEALCGILLEGDPLYGAYLAEHAAKLRRSAEGLRRSSDPNGPALAAQADALAAELEEKRDAI